MNPKALLRVVETPALAKAMRRLPAVALAQALDAVGLEDSAALLALTTRDQLVQLVDHDLWRPSPSADRFDADRFGLWLEVLLELGPAVAAEKLAALDEDFLTFALGERFVVLDLEALAAMSADTDGDQARAADKQLESSLGQELGGYFLVAKREDGWDATLAVLLALDTLDPELVERILSRLWAASAEHIADDGLSSLLSLSEQLASDAAFAREERLEVEGFVTAENARLVLALAWLDSADADADADDPITKRYLRRVAPTIRVPTDDHGHFDAVLADLLAHEPALPSRRLGGGGEAPLPILAALAAADPDETALRLGFLVNVLVAATAGGPRPLRPVEAADAVLAYANAGYATDRPFGILACFRRGWTRAEELALAAARHVDHPRVRAAPDRKKAHIARGVTEDAALRLLVAECPSLPGAWVGRADPVFPATEEHFACAYRHLALRS